MGVPPISSHFVRCFSIMPAMSPSNISSPPSEVAEDAATHTVDNASSMRAGFTLIELLVSLVIIMVLASLTFVIMGRMNEGVRSTQCMNQLRTIGMAARAYANNNEGVLPFTQHQARSRMGQSWVASLQPYADGTVTFRCPSDPKKDRLYSYAINDYLTPNPAGAKDLDFSISARISMPMSTLLFGECAETYTGSDHFHFSKAKSAAALKSMFQSSVATQRHANVANYLFADGHVEALNWNDVSRRLTESGSRFVHPEPEN